MVTVPSGSILLNDARTKTSRTARLRSYQISRTPVTWEQYTGLLDLQTPEDSDPDTPVHSISWLGAIDWCNRLSVELGLPPAYQRGHGGIIWDVSSAGVRLPTEAEWEWACRAGTTGPHYGPLSTIAWTEADHVDSPQKVQQKQPNAFGLYDMLGNVWEWCWDYADPARYADYRVLRGGGWADKHWSVRASVRRGSTPGLELDDVGFRLAKGAVGVTDDHAAQGWSHHADQERARGSGTTSGWTPLEL